MLAHATRDAQRLELTCGPLAMSFEPASGFVRYITVGGTEVLRGVYAVVRDHNWDTLDNAISDLRVDRGDDRFEITFHARCQRDDIDFRWHGRIVGERDGTLEYSFDGEALAAFRRNRIGFCVLHPIESCKGKPCEVEHVDGRVTRGQFPYYISPHQPFMDMRAIRHEVAPGVRAEVRFDGEVFEMEDQRNWTDASYKTYCTPLARPFPVQLEAGERVQQTVTLSLISEPAALRPPSRPAPAVEPPRITIQQATTVPLPPVGLGVASQDEPLDDRHLSRLRALAPTHLRADLWLDDDQWRHRLEQAAREAHAVGASLEVAVFVAGDDPADPDVLRESTDQLTALRDAMGEIAMPSVARWLIFQENHAAATPTVLAAARRLLRCQEHEPSPVVGSGHDAYLTELNRQRPAFTAMDVVSYSLNPQVHAFDDASLVETLPMQAETVQSARHLVGEVPIVVTPVTLRPRFNPNATAPGAPPPRADPRQPTRFAAGWTLASVRHLARAGVQSVTYYETSGDRGVMAGDTVFPVYHALADITAFGGEVLDVATSRPLIVDALALRHSGRTRLLAANLTPSPQAVTIEGVNAAQVNCRWLDEPEEALAMHEPERYRENPGVPYDVRDGTLELALRPHAVARIDW